MTAYDRARDALDRMLDALRDQDAPAMRAATTEDIAVASSHRGALQGAEGLAGLFGPVASDETFSLVATNVYLAGDVQSARASAYLAGDARGVERLAFGAIMVADLVQMPNGDWRVSTAKVQITWVEGATTLRPSWSFPDHARIWQAGDPLPVVVSELDAPWHVYPRSTLVPDADRVLADTYARYSWGIDQADFGLLAGCYTPDAAGTFQPLGPLSGRSAIIGVLKDFRRAWPVMQHYGEVLASTVDGDRAAIVVGRIIPQAGYSAGTYGAYYPMRLQRDGNSWRITWSEYRPHWFTRDSIDLPELLAATLSGAGDQQQEGTRHARHRLS